MTQQLSGMILADVDFYIKGLFKYNLFGQELWFTTTHVGLIIVVSHLSPTFLFFVENPL